MADARLIPEFRSILQDPVLASILGIHRLLETEIPIHWLTVTLISRDQTCTPPRCSGLTGRQLDSFGIAIRSSASVSLLACLLVISTYIFSSRFHTPINRLVFYATCGNLLAHTAELIAESGPEAGPTSSLCRFQAFFIQWFTSADALWKLCMANNVYLSLFRRHNLLDLRKMEWRYCVVCYGLQFIPAFVFFFIKTKSRGRVYDEALFWCWISRPWSVLRLTLYFGPVWFSIIVGSLIHIAAGIKIYIYERGVRSATASNKLVFAAPSHEASAEEQGSENQQPNESQSSTGLEDLSVGGQSVSQSQASPQDAFTPELQTVPCNQVTRAEASGSVSASSAQSQSKYENEALSHDSLVAAGQTVSGVLLESTVNQHPVAQLLSVDWDPRLGHGPGSLLELVDSRQPSSNTRNSADLENGMNIAPEEKPSQARRQSIQRQNAARSHAQFASIYFISLLITWMPSTANRIYMSVHPPNASYGLALAAAISLPLQGFWNGVIFFSTSWFAVKSIFWSLRFPQHWSTKEAFRRFATAIHI